MLQALAGQAAREFTGRPKSLHLNLGEKAAPPLQPLRSKGAPSSDAPGGGRDDVTCVDIPARR